MRKFVVKNRQKRKYVRKSEKTSSYSFSKTFYGTLPILIMAIAFMATIIISPSLRNTLLHIKFTLQPIHFPNIQFPKFSLANPTPFFQALAFDRDQIDLAAIGVLSAIWINIIHLFTPFSNAASHSTIIFDPQPLLDAIENTLLAVGSFTVDGTVFLGQSLVKIYETFTTLSLFTETFVVINISFVINDIIHALIIGFHLGMTTTDALLQSFIKSVLITAQFITTITSIVLATFIRILSLALHSILSVLDAAWIWINSVTNAIIRIVEIPFNILGEFGLAMKPYIDFFDRHVAMTGKDFSDGVSSLGKAASYVSTSK